MKLLKLQMNKLKINRKIKVLDLIKLEKYKLNNDCINIINIEYNPKKPSKKYHQNQITI